MTTIEWAAMGALWTVVLALVGYIWHSTTNRVENLDHPTTGALVLYDQQSRERTHKLSTDIQTVVIDVAVLTRDSIGTREDLKDLKKLMTEVSLKLERLLGRAGLDSDRHGE